MAALLAASVAPARAQTPADEPRPITLDEAVRLAQRNAPIAVQARGQTRTARVGERSALASFIPNVTLSAGSSRQGGDRYDSQGQLVPFLGDPWSYNTGVSANVELFDGGRRFHEIRQARATTDAADANEVAQRFRVALEVKQQYAASLGALESEAAARAQLEQARAQLSASTTRIRAGVATKSDSLRSVIQLGNAQLALLTARNNRRVADAALTRLVATPFPVAASPSDTLDRPLTIDSATLAAFAERGPAVDQARANLSAARAARRAAWTPYLPTISASYSRSGNGNDRLYGLGDDRYAYSDALRFNLSYPLFNQFQREEQRVRASVAEDNAEAALRDATLLARQTLAQQLGALRTAEQRIAIQAASVAAADEDLRVQQQRYALGASTLLDVLTSQSQLDQARAALIAARLDYRIARAQLEALVGRDL